MGAKTFTTIGIPDELIKDVVEKDFAIDSTGFGTSNFQRWYSFKHGKEINSRKWVKCHFITGVKTNVIPSVKITTEFDNQQPRIKGITKQDRRKL
jgi:hypothetical protein